MRNLTKHIILILNSIAVIALCLAYLAGFINPETFWGVAFLGLAYPFLVIVNIFFIIFWWSRKNKNAFFSLLAIFLGLGILLRYIQFPNKKIPSSNSLNIISYNVRIFNYYEWENKSFVIDSILDFVSEQIPEIVCFQEFFSRSSDPKLSEQYIKQKLNSLPFSHIQYSKVFNNGKSHFGIATFSKFPIINKGIVQFYKSVNACIYSDILVRGDTFRLYNAHLQSIHLRKDNYTLLDSIFHLNTKKIDKMRDVSSRMKKAYIARSEQTLKISEHISKSPYPVILCGDFNDTPASYTYKKLLGNKKDAYRESGSGFGQTYRGKLPSFRIDYIFYSPYFHSNNYKTHKIKYSDHFPISSSLIPKGR